MSRRLVLGAASVTLLASVGLVSCGSSASGQEPTVTDPRVGWVRIFDDELSNQIRKRCDGSTLIYAGGYYSQLTAVPDAKECAA